MHRQTFHILVVGLSLLVTGCVSSTERNKTAGLDLTSYNSGNADAVFWQHGWWEQYKDKQLNALIHTAFLQNPDLNQIRARLAQAQAVTKSNRSSFFPSLDASGGLSEIEGDSSQSTGSNYSLIGAASYELDLWGKNRANVTSARLQEQASREDFYAGGVTLAANIVNNWLQVLSLREQESIIRKQIETNKTVLQLQENRFERGSAGALDVLQQEENLARSLALLPDILSAQRQAKNSLAVLIGQTPNDGLDLNVKSLPAPLALPPNGLPSDLLSDRPDILASWSRLMAADWAEWAAFTDRLPRFDLTVTYTSNATKIADLFSVWLLDMAVSAALPIIDGGARRAEELRREALADEAFFAYQNTVLQAVLDVENNLTQNVYQDQKLDALRKQLVASSKTLEQAQFSYANGESSYINVLNSLTNSQSLEQQIAVERLTQAQARVNLYRALGGRSWASLMTEQTIEQDFKDE